MLWAEQRDTLAIHTLIMASYHVLYDLLKRRDPEFSKFQQELLTKIGLKKFNETSNFLKHADRDPHEEIEDVSAEENEYRIGFCIVAFRVITNELTPELAAFHLMSLMTYPDNFKVYPDSDPDIEAIAQYAAKRAQRDVECRIALFQLNRTLMLERKIPVSFRLKRHKGEN